MVFGLIATNHYYKICVADKGTKNEPNEWNEWKRKRFWMKAEKRSDRKRKTKTKRPFKWTIEQIETIARFLSHASNCLVPCVCVILSHALRTSNAFNCLNANFFARLNSTERCCWWRWWRRWLVEYLYIWAIAWKRNSERTFCWHEDKTHAQL